MMKPEILLLSARTAFGAPAFDVPRLEHVLVGGGSAEWDQTFRIEHLIPLRSPLPAREAFGASARLGWNDEGLLVLVTVTGDGGNQSEQIEQLWSGDSVELYLAPSSESPDLCQWLIAPGVSERFPTARMFLHDARRSEGVKGQPGEIVVATRRTATGYQVEALLPWHRSSNHTPRRSPSNRPRNGCATTCT